jgi:proton-translocating NAD(P)+ transhydrogenase subunit alpha
MSVDLMFDIYIFVLAILAGYEVITNVPSTLHTPLMSASNAIHGIVIIGAMVTASEAHSTAGYVLAFLAAWFAGMNVVGGYVLTDRMLKMFRKRPLTLVKDGKNVASSQDRSDTDERKAA